PRVRRSRPPRRAGPAPPARGGCTPLSTGSSRSACLLLRRAHLTGVPPASRPMRPSARDSLPPPGPSPRGTAVVPGGRRRRMHHLEAHALDEADPAVDAEVAAWVTEAYDLAH